MRANLSSGAVGRADKGGSQIMGADTVRWQLVVDELTAVSERLRRIERKLDEERREALAGASVPSRTFTAKEFAERVGVSRDTVRLWVLKGKVKKKNGRIPPSELRRFGL